MRFGTKNGPFIHIHVYLGGKLIASIALLSERLAAFQFVWGQCWKSTTMCSCLFCEIQFTMARYLNCHMMKFDCYSGFAATEVNSSFVCSGPMSNYVQLLPNCPNLGLFAVGRLLLKPNHLSHHLISKWTCGNVYSLFRSILTFMIETSLKSEDIAALPHIM